MNYFELFGLPTQYRISKDDLTKSYLSLQRELRQQSDKSSDSVVQLNAAYKVLKDDIERGKYFLTLFDKKSESLSSEFALKMFSMRENFENLKTENERTDFLQKLKSDMQNMIQDLQTIDDIEKFREKFSELEFIHSFLEKARADVYSRN